MNLLDESGRQKLVDLLPNDFALLLIEAAQALLHWFRTGSDLQGLLGDFPWYARHIWGTPCKHISIRVEKVNDHGFLFGVEVGTDRQCLAVGVVGIGRDLLGAFRWLEAACMALWLWCCWCKNRSANTKGCPIQTLRHASWFDLAIDKGDNLNTLVPTTAMHLNATAKRYSHGTWEFTEYCSMNPLELVKKRNV